MQLENDVQRLKLLKSTYDSQRYTLEDNITIRFPKLIKAAQEKAECVRQDMKKVEEGLLAAQETQEFAITIGNAKYTERVDGGTVMLEAVSRCKNGETSHLGEFKGFELLVEKNFIGVELPCAARKERLQDRAFHKSGREYGKTGKSAWRNVGKP